MQHSYPLTLGLVLWLAPPVCLPAQEFPPFDSIPRPEAPSLDSLTYELEAIPSLKLLPTEAFSGAWLDHPLEGLAGRVPGLWTSRPGSDPLETPELRWRGQPTFFQRANPLLLVDGLPLADPGLLHPADVAQAAVVEDPVGLTLFGEAGGAGVVLLETLPFEGAGALRYAGTLLLEAPAGRVPVLTPEEFLAIGGQDYGARSDWQEAVTRRSLSQDHHLSFGGGGELPWRLSLHHRRREGVLRGSDMRQSGARFRLARAVFDERLRIQTRLALTTRTAHPSFPEAFRYAVSMPPTAPLHDPDPNPFGGWFQVPYFDVFNPVALLEQNQRERRRNHLSGGLQLEWNPLDFLRLTLRHASAVEDRKEALFHPSTDAYRGRNLGGLARQDHRRRQVHRTEGVLRGRHRWRGLGLGWSLGYDLTLREEEALRALVHDFITDAFAWNDLGAALSLSRGEGELSTYRARRTQAGGFAQVRLRWRERLAGGFLMRRGGDSYLGANAKWGWYPGGHLSWRFWNAAPTRFATLSLSYGESGGAPLHQATARGRMAPFGAAYAGGEWVPIWWQVQGANPLLEAERRQEWNLRLSWSLGTRLSGAFTLFRARADRLIQEGELVRGLLELPRWENSGRLNNAGWSFALDWHTLNGGLQSRQALAISAQSVRLERWNAAGLPELRGTLGGPGTGGRVLRFADDRPFAEFFLPVLLSVSPDGQVIHKDVNGDGFFCHCEDDAEPLGTGWPTLQLGWEHTLRWKGWSLRTLLRGVFGHRQMSVLRAVYEQPRLSFQNQVRTAKFLPQTDDFLPISSHYVEKASFLRLEFLQLGYAFGQGPERPAPRWSLTLTAHNLFSLSGYSGLDPEPRLADPGAALNGSFPPEEKDPLLLGLDRRNTYAKTRGWALGVVVEW